MILFFNRISIKFFLRSLKRCKFLLAVLFKVLSAFVVSGLPFSKLVCSSTVSGFTRTPNLIILDVSFSFSASFTKAQPMEVVPKSRPKTFFIIILFLFSKVKKNKKLPNT